MTTPVQAFKSVVVDDRIKSYFGDPIFPLVDSETDIIQRAKTSALLDIYNAKPISYSKTIEVPSGVVGNVEISISDLKEEFFPDQSVRDNAYFLGVLNHQFRNNTAVFSDLDRILLGTGVRLTNVRYATNQRIDPTVEIDLATQNDLITGEVRMVYDELNEKIQFMLPTTAGFLYVSYGFGYINDSKLPVNLYPLYADRAAMYALNGVAVGMKKVTMNADFSIDPSEYLSKSDQLRESTDKELSLIATPVMIYV